jgi:hypothetical protein
MDQWRRICDHLPIRHGSNEQLERHAPGPGRRGARPIARQCRRVLSPSVDVIFGFDEAMGPDRPGGAASAGVRARFLAGPPRVNCWTIAEHAEEASPGRMQHLLLTGLQPDQNRIWWAIVSRPARSPHGRICCSPSPGTRPTLGTREAPAAAAVQPRLAVSGRRTVLHLPGHAPLGRAVLEAIDRLRRAHRTAHRAAPVRARAPGPGRAVLNNRNESSPDDGSPSPGGCAPLGLTQPNGSGDPQSKYPRVLGS